MSRYLAFITFLAFFSSCGNTGDPDLAQMLIAVANVSAGDTVAIVGLKTAWLTSYLASKVGPEGRLYAFEKNVQGASQLSQGIRRQFGHRNNIAVFILPEKRVGLPVLMDVMFITDDDLGISDFNQMFRSIQASIKRSGKLVILNNGSIDIDEIRNVVEVAGFDMLVWRRLGTFNSAYYIIFRKR